jgi:lysophospholipase L1-like esterase
MLKKRILFWGLLPLGVPQGLLLRRTALRFGAAPGETFGAVGTGNKISLVAIGDSIVAGVGAGRADNALAGATAAELARISGAEVSWQAVGKIGATASSVLAELVPQLQKNTVDVFVVSVGVNDVTSLIRTGRWAANLTALFESLRAHSPQATIAMVGVPPMGGFPLLPKILQKAFGMRGETFDEVARQIIQQKKAVIHVPMNFDPSPEKFSADGYHPCAESYAEIGKVVAEAIVEFKKS